MATDNHNLNEPADGATNWGDSANQNFRDIDTLFTIFDTSGNRSTYTPKAGATYCETDTGEWYEADGSSWSRFGVFGGGAGTVQTAMVLNSEDDWASLAEDGRPLYSQGHTQAFVDPTVAADDVDTYDSAAGTQADPYGSVDDALYHLAFVAQLHQFEIQLDNPGVTYAGPQTEVLIPPSTTGYTSDWGPNSGQSFLIEGDSANPTDYTFDATHKFHIGFTHSGPSPNVEVKGCYLKGGINLDGAAKFTDCHIGGRDDPGGTAIKGYSGWGIFENCTFTANCEEVISADHLKRCVFRNCTFDNTGVIMDFSNRGSGPHVFDSVPRDSGGSKVPLYETDSIRKGSPTIVHGGGAEFTGQREGFLVET